jgi:hypothetical protein
MLPGRYWATKPSKGDEAFQGRRGGHGEGDQAGRVGAENTGSAGCAQARQRRILPALSEYESDPSAVVV